MYVRIFSYILPSLPHYDICSEDFFGLIIDLTLLQHNLTSNKQRDENGESVTTKIIAGGVAGASETMITVSISTHSSCGK
jgi:hypothetical protein